MRTQDTVIVAGAGCSAEFDLPTGKSLVDRLRKEDIDPINDTYNLNRDLFSKGFSLFLKKAHLTQKYNRSNDFLSEAKNMLADSIDLHAYWNPAHLPIAKLYSSWGIIASMYVEKSMPKLGYEPVAGLYKKDIWRQTVVKKNKNWIAALVQKYLDGCKSSADLNPESLSIVTFNYDSIIEDAFGCFVRSLERFRDVTDEELPTVHHVYGSFPTLPDVLEDPCEIDRASERIHYINDFNGTEKHIKTIQALIKSAKNIIIVGFDFDPLNVELIQLNQSRANKIALVYDGNDRLKARLKKIGIEGERIHAGTFNEPLSIGVAASRGFFDLANLLSDSPPQLVKNKHGKLRDDF